MNGYVVQFQLKGMQQAIAQMQAFTKALTAAKAANTGISRGSGGSRGSSSPTAQSNANAKNVNAQANFLRAQAAWLRAQVAAYRAQNRQARQGSSFWGAAKQLLYSTRIGLGGGGISVMPLIGNLLKMFSALGPEAEAAALAIGILISALAGWQAAAVSFGVGTANAQAASGGTIGEAAKLGGIGAAAGIGAAQMGSAAAQYNEWLKTNPYANARAQAGGYGPNYSGAFGDQDDARRMIRGIQDMLDAPTFKEAVKRTRGGPIQQFDWMWYADRQVIKNAQDASTMQTSPQALKDAANTQIEFNEAMSQATLLMVQLGQMVLPNIITGLELVNLALYEFRKLLGLGGNDPMDDINKAKADAQAKHTDATNRNTDAVNGMARALNNSTQIAGGGPNSQHALPGKWIGPGSTRSQINYGQVPI